MKKVVTPKRGWVDIEVRLLRPAPWNYKIEDQELARKLEANIRKNGLVLNIVVRELGDGTYEVLDGNHRLVAIQNIGLKKVHAYNVGPISELQAKRLAIELNESRFIADDRKMFPIIQELLQQESIDELDETLPFQRQLLEELDRVAQQPVQFPAPGPDGYIEASLESGEQLESVSEEGEGGSISENREDDQESTNCAPINCLTCETQEMIAEFVREYALPMEPNIIIKRLWELLQKR